MATFANPDNTMIRDEEIKSDKGSFSPKRKLEVTALDKENIHEESEDPNKKLKLGIPAINSNDPSTAYAKTTGDVNGAENQSGHADIHNEQVEEGEDDEDEEDYEDKEEEDNDEEDDSDDEDSDGNTDIVDHKGKGIMKDDKGKGKLVEESENSSASENESDFDSDLSDDPLAEVDLDNILPTRTRQRVVQRGVCISKNQGTKQDKDGHSEDNS